MEILTNRDDFCIEVDTNMDNSENRINSSVLGDVNDRGDNERIIYESECRICRSKW